MVEAKIKEKILLHSVSFGCDPEFFFEKKGKIVGSEKIIAIKEGLNVGAGSRIIVDGVQAEINPRANSCRERLASEISVCFKELKKKMEADKDLKINFLPTVKITKKELMTLDKKSRVFGCAPSKNTNKSSENAVALRNPEKYMYRSAGGHIHIGGMAGAYSGFTQSPTNTVLKEPERLVAIMDILVGNTCVLIDRDPSNVERRKTYGKAGEFRTPTHGVEYRTLSNFWLRSYPLMSFVMNLSRTSVSIMASSMPGRDFEKELLACVDMQKIHKAINTNDFSIAWENFQAIKPFITSYIPENAEFPLTETNLKAFEFFVAKGLDHWFKEEPMEHWLKYAGSASFGWERFIKNVQSQMVAEPSKKPDVK